MQETISQNNKISEPLAQKRAADPEFKNAYQALISKAPPEPDFVSTPVTLPLRRKKLARLRIPEQFTSTLI